MNAVVTMSNVKIGFLRPEALSDGRIIKVGRVKAPSPAPSERRDPRAMNHMDPETRLVHSQLEQWGKETRDGAESGYPSTTLLGRVIEQGPGAPQPGAPVSHLSPQSARVDACVSRLWKRAQSCIKRYYRSWEPPEVMARKEGVTVREFRRILQRARWLIGSWLTDAHSGTDYLKAPSNGDT